MLYDLTLDPRVKCGRIPLPVRLLDMFFILILYMGNFTMLFIDKETGSGRYVPMMILAFGVLSIPFWRYYYSRWNIAIALFAAFFSIGALSDILYLGGYNLGLFVLQRQLFMNVYYVVVAYNMMYRDHRHIRRIVYAIVISAAINAVLMALGVSVAESVERGVEGTRASLLGQNANATSRVFAVGLLFVALMAMKMIVVNSIVFWVLLGVAPLMFVGMLHVGSRGGLLALALSVPAILMTAKSVEKKMVIFVCVAAMTIVGVFAIMQNEMIYSRISNTLLDRDTGGREQIFYACIYSWGKAKLLGHGLIMYGRELAIETGHINWGYSTLASHCTYTFALCSSGICGVVFYFAFLCYICYRAMKVRHYPFGNFCFLSFVLSIFCALTQNIEKSTWPALIYALTLVVYDKLRMRGFV